MSLLLTIFKIASKSTTGLRQDLVFDNVVIFTHYKMIYLESIGNKQTNKQKTEHDEKWPYIPDHLYRILIIGGSDDIDKIYLYAKDLSKPKLEFLKMQGQNILMISMHLLSALILWMMFRKILIVTTQSKKEKFSLFWMTWSQTLWVRKHFRP